YIPPDQRKFTQAVPTKMVLSAPDAKGFVYETDSGQALGPAYPDLPYLGPADPPNQNPNGSSTSGSAGNEDTSILPTGNSGIGPPPIAQVGIPVAAGTTGASPDRSGTGSGNVQPSGGVTGGAASSGRPVDNTGPGETEGGDTSSGRPVAGAGIGG